MLLCESKKDGNMKTKLNYILVILFAIITTLLENIELNILLNIALCVLLVVLDDGKLLKKIFTYLVTIYILTVVKITFNEVGYDIYELFLIPIFPLIGLIILISITCFGTTSFKYSLNKTKDRKVRIFNLLFSITMFLLLFTFYNSFFSNPLTKQQAKDAMQAYVDESYPELSLDVDSVFYNFKFNTFEATAISDLLYHNLDLVYYPDNKLVHDNYEYAIENKNNIIEVLSEEYIELVKDDLTDYEYQYLSAELVDIDVSSLDINKVYDVNDFTNEYGSIFIRINGAATEENLVKEILNFNNNIINDYNEISRFIIEGKDESISIGNLKKEDINDDTLEEIVEKENISIKNF